MITTLIILALSAVFFVNGKLRSDLVALCALVLLIVFNILTPEEALSGFSNPIVIMMVGLFVVGGAIFKTGLAKMISSKILRLAGKSELKLFILIMVVTAFIGAFVSNTGYRGPHASDRSEHGGKRQYQSREVLDALGFR